MADERADPPCPCTHPEDPQFELLSDAVLAASEGKRPLGMSCSSFAVVLALHLVALIQC